MSFARHLGVPVLVLVSAGSALACRGDDPNPSGIGDDDAGASPDASTSGSFVLRAMGTAVLARNETIKVPVQIERKDGFTGAVTLVVPPLVTGIGVAPLTLTDTQVTGDLEITASSSAEPAVTRLQVVATAAPALSDTEDLPLVIRGPAGTRDTTYGDKDGTTILQDVTAFAYAGTADGGVVIASATSVTRARADGKLDTAFGVGGKVDLAKPGSRTVAVRVAKDEKILVFGYSSDRKYVAVHRFLPNGVYDTTYGKEGIALYELAKPEDQPYAFGGDVDTEGRAVVGIVPGIDGTSIFVRFLVDGQLDTAFMARGLKTTSGGWREMRVRGETPIAFGSSFYDAQSKYSKFALALVTSESAVPRALPAESNMPWVTSASFDAQGKMLIAGYSSYSDEPGNATAVIARANADGSPDDTFGSLGIVSDDFAGGEGAYAEFGVALEDASSKILAIGTLEKANGSRVHAVVRYDSGGRPDQSFGVNGFVLDDVPGAEKSVGGYLQPTPTVVVVRSYSPGSTLLTRYWR